MNKGGKIIAWCALSGAVGCGPTTPDWKLAPPRNPDEIGQLEMVPDHRPIRIPSTLPTTLPAVLAAPTTAPASVEITIAQVRQWAIANNLDLKVTAYSPEIAKQSLSAEEAKFESTFFTNASAGNTDRPTISPFLDNQGENQTVEPGIRIPLRTGGEVRLSSPLSRSDNNATDSSYANAMQASIAQPLLRNAGETSSEYSIRIAGYNTELTRVRSRLEVTRILAAVDRAYWRLYAARQQLDVARQQYELAGALLERSRRLLAAGQGVQVEVTRAESGLADRIEAVITTQGNLNDRERELKRLLNQANINEQTTLIPKSPPRPVHYATDAEQLVNNAMQNRSEMFEQELLLAREALSIKYFRNQKLPLLSVTYTYRVNGLGDTPADAYDMSFGRDYQEHTLGLVLDIPIGNDAAKARLRQVMLERLQQLSSKAAQALLIRKEVLDATQQLETSWMRIIAGQARTILAKRTLDAEQRQLEAGLRTNTDVLDAITRLADAKSSEISALANYEISQIDLAYATGTLLGQSKVDWEQDIKIDQLESKATTQPGAMP